jgi:hypothetical protein
MATRRIAVEQVRDRSISHAHARSALQPMHGFLKRIPFFSDECPHWVNHNLVHQQRIEGGLMIEREIQALSERREGLLVEVGRFVIENGFTLQRQRLVQDPHGILLTMVVRGPRRGKHALESALDAYDRIISFEVAPHVEGEQRPHFAASRKVPNYVPAARPEPPPEPATEPARTAATDTVVPPAIPAVAFDEVAPARLTAAPATAPAPAIAASPPARPQPDFEFILPEAPRAPPAPPPVVEVPFVELVALEPDQAAIDKVLSKLDTEYPQIMTRLLTLARSVPEGAREPSLRVAGQRIGRSVFEREHAQTGTLGLDAAIEQIGLPALRALVEIDLDGRQVHIHHSPLCAEDGHSGCAFFSGFLEGLLAPTLASSEMTIFPVCCCSYGADDCVLALSD